MKIALAFPGVHRRGGVERIILESARFLAGRGHQVEVFANEWEPLPDAGLDFRFVDVRRLPRFLAPRSYRQRSTRMLAGETFDVLGTFGCECPTGGILWMQSLHRAWLERSRQFRSPFSIGRIRQRLNPLHPVLLKLEAEQFAPGAYRKLIVTTPEVRADLGRFYGVPAGDVEIVSNGFSPTEFNPERRANRRAEMREKLGLQPDQIAILFVGNELERKGYPTLLDAMRRLGRPDIRLLVVGRPDASKVKALADAAGVAQGVIWCGPTADVAAFHAAADLFVLPTQYEAFCLAILEALGSGLPVITTDIPGARDAIRPGINGSIIKNPLDGEELASALSAALDPDRRMAMSAAAPASVSAYQWPVVLERYENLLMQYSTL